MISQPYNLDKRYIVYNDGRIWSTISNKFMSYSTSSGGYYRCVLNGKSRQIHRIIAETFLREPLLNEVVHHKDHDKLNNHIDNLEWTSRSKNAKEANQHHGSWLKGEANGRSKLTEKDIRDIRLDTNPNRLIANMYKVSIRTIEYIKSGKTWKHVT